jgi:hypothetical protein
VQIFRRAARVRSAGNLFGLFAMVTIIVTLLLLSYDLPFESAFPLLALCFSGVSLEECAPRFVLENRDARVAHIHPDACGSRSGKDFAIGPPKAGAPAS